MGAIGTHTLRRHLSPHDLELWRTAVRYLQTHALALVATGIFSPRDRRARRVAGVAGVLLAGGAVLFAGAVAGLAVGGPRILGAVAPVGGLSLVAGWIALALAAVVAIRAGPDGPDPGPDGAQGPAGPPR